MTITAALFIAGCNKYIDVVPDNVATLEYAFRMRTTAEKYLATCYSFIPDLGSISVNLALLSGDELCVNTGLNNNSTRIARGGQNTNNTYHDYWNRSEERSVGKEGVKRGRSWRGR